VSLSFAADFVPEDGRDLLAGIYGIGVVAPPSHTFPVGHTYIEFNDVSTATPVMAPAEGRLYLVEKLTRPDGKVNIGIQVALCEGISYGFGHLNGIEPALADRIGCTGEACSWRLEQGPEVLVSVGDVLGYKGGDTADVQMLDFGVVDTSSDPAAWPGGEEVWGDYLHSSCPYGYFTDPATREFYFELLARYSPRELVCGTLDTHIDGRLQGFWFAPDAALAMGPDAERHHLVIGLDIASEKRSYVSGGGLGPAGFHFDVDPEPGSPTNPSPDTVAADGTKHCFGPLYNHPLTPATIPGFLMVEMTSDADLIAEYIDSGSCPADVDGFVFGEGAKSFTRDID
jgi:hypothetical protein